MGTIYDALEYIRMNATSEKDKGTQFERLTRFFLKNDPLWKSRFSEVWMWSNAPTNDGADIGIDLVAKDREDNSYLSTCRYILWQNRYRRHISSYNDRDIGIPFQRSFGNGSGQLEYRSHFYG